MPTVFKKDVQIKSDQKLSGKDAKKIIASVQALYGEEASSMLGKKDVSLRRTGGGTVATLYCSEAGPLFFEAEGDAGGAGGASLLPTLLALWRAPLLPTLLPPLLPPLLLAPPLPSPLQQLRLSRRQPARTNRRRRRLGRATFPPISRRRHTARRRFGARPLPMPPRKAKAEKKS